MAIVPIGERVLIKPTLTQEKTKGGIYLPDSAREEKKTGEVVAVGTTSEGKPLPVQKGDKVLYGGYSSDEFDIDGEKYIMLDFKDVLAKVE